jgi:hypothetical protein
MRVAVPLIALALATWVSVGRGEEAGVADLPFEILRTGGIANKTIPVSQLTLVRDETFFRAVWGQLQVSSTASDPGTVPSVDFDHWMVVAFFGSQGDNCDPYRLTRVIARPGKITLHINHHLPSGNCTCASDVFEPYIVAKIPWTEKPIDFEIEPGSSECP